MVGRHDVTTRYDTGDDMHGRAQVMERFLNAGHRRIAHLTLRAEVTIPTSPHGMRLEGYRRSMRDHVLGGHECVVGSDLRMVLPCDHGRSTLVRCMSMERIRMSPGSM